MRRAAVYYCNSMAGVLCENDEGYTFAYDADYLAGADARPVSLTLPLSDKPYISRVMFPFFDGLIPEGWLLDVALHSWKINARDRMSLLMACCADCIGAVSIRPMDTNDEQEEVEP